ncbi:hypothetical protein BDC45DRAFT_531921 [Circinella umbellata]|nr:hypothetical protein BDC45DRAFT_531921 [Circinella umbellata]
MGYRGGRKAKSAAQGGHNYSILENKIISPKKIISRFMITLFSRYFLALNQEGEGRISGIFTFLIPRHYHVRAGKENIKMPIACLDDLRKLIVDMPRVCRVLEKPFIASCKPSLHQANTKPTSITTSAFNGVFFRMP